MYRQKNSDRVGFFMFLFVQNLFCVSLFTVLSTFFCISTFVVLAFRSSEIMLSLCTFYFLCVYYVSVFPFDISCGMLILYSRYNYRSLKFHCIAWQALRTNITVWHNIISIVYSLQTISWEAHRTLTNKHLGISKFYSPAFCC